MIKNPVLLYKTLVFGVIVLFIGMSIVSSTSNIAKLEHTYIENQLGKSSFNVDNDTTPPITTHTLDPPEPDGYNGWYVNDVTVTLKATDDISGVKEIRYIINGWSEHIISGDNGSFILLADGEGILIEYWAIDNAGNIETKNELEIDIDQTEPEVDLTYEYNSKFWEDWVFKFTATATDYMSGMDRVEFYFMNVLQETVIGPGPTYTWTIKYLPCSKHWMVITAIAYDKAGLSDYDEVEDPKTTSNNYLKNIQQDNKNVNFLRIFFRNLEVLLRITGLSR